MLRRNGTKSLPQLLEPGFEALGQLHTALVPPLQFAGGSRLSFAHGLGESLKVPPREESDLSPGDDTVGALPHLGRRSTDFRRSVWSASDKFLHQRPVSNSVRRLPSLCQVDFAATWSVDIPFRSGTADSGVDGARRKTAWFPSDIRNSLNSNGGLENAKVVKFAGVPVHGPDSYELAQEQKKKKMLALGGGKGGKQLTVVQRKRNHAAALAGDRQYVMAYLDEGREPDEQRKAREQATKEYWLEAAFAPVPSPWTLLPPELQERLPPPPLSEHGPSQSSPHGRVSLQSGGTPDVQLDNAEVEEIIKVCLLFRALVESPKGGDQPNVLTRQDFCRLVCAAQGLAVTPGARPMLCRAVSRFDSLAEMVYTKTSEHGVHGVLIPPEDMLDPEGSSLSTLFGWLVHDISKELQGRSAMPANKMKPADIKGAEVTEEETKKLVHEPARNRFFGVLLPQAKKFAELRAQKVKQHIGLAALSAPVEASQPQEAPAEAKEEVEDDGDEDKDDLNDTFFCETFAFIKGEALLGQLCEPEVLRFVAETRETVKILFRAYADVPTAVGGGHMSMAALLRFCEDFGMFPKIIDYQTVKWLYGLDSSDSQAAKVVPRRLSAASSEIPSLQSIPPSAPPSRGESKTGSFEKRKSRVRKNMRAPPQPPVDEGFMYHNKFLKRHLAWMAKEPGTMGELELRSCYLLTAVDEWMGSRNLRVADLFSQMGKTDAFNAHDLWVAVEFMDFEDPPTKDDTIGLVGLLVQPDRTMPSCPPSPSSPSSPSMRDEGDVDFATFQMALTAARKIREKRSRATNCFLKDITKMSRAESSAAIFFKDLLAILEKRNLTPETLFRMADIDSRGEVPARDLIIQIHALFRMQVCLSAGVAIQNPFEMLGKELDDMITKQELVDLIEEAKDARQLREMNRDDKHPLSVAVPPPSVLPASAERGGVSLFGQRAFAEILMKLGFLHLNNHATATQAELSSFHKCLWLFVFLHWKFDCTQREISHLIQEKQCSSCGRSPSRSSASRPISRSRSRPGSSASSRPGSSSGGRRFPKHMPPMRKLLARFPKLFENSFKERPLLLAADTSAAEDTDQDIADRLLHACLSECQEFDEDDEARVAASGPNALERILIAAAVLGSPLGSS
eukprot:TRINITY_DN34131_c0_g1_i1.p1 TRINITY_DN34131_c0_g1~~TRINITY_DN34131_c0_g1_i1.p1  ORF type:complete len:1132 (-),score=225.98 TRINITY_DN34131_c0_g1_i1:147-3542(-)